MLFWNINIRIPCMNLCLQSPDDLFETISQALMNAFDRDAVSGWGAVVYIMWVGLLVFKWQCWLFQIVLSYLTVCKEFAPIPETPGAPPLSADTIGWFSEAGLLEWMCLVIFRARGCSTLPGRFLSRHCFTLCITVEVEPRIVKQYCCSCKNYKYAFKVGSIKFANSLPLWRKYTPEVKAARGLKRCQAKAWGWDDWGLLVGVCLWVPVISVICT